MELTQYGPVWALLAVLTTLLGQWLLAQRKAKSEDKATDVTAQTQAEQASLERDRFTIDTAKALLASIQGDYMELKKRVQELECSNRDKDTRILELQLANRRQEVKIEQLEGEVKDLKRRLEETMKP